MKSILEKASKIKLAIFDVDGVLTDGTLFYTDTTIQVKAFHVHDGLGIKLLQQSGINVAIITSHESEMITRRMEALDIKHVYQGRHQKMPAYDDLLQKLDVKPEQVSYMGDDLPDLALIRRSGLGITVPSAVALVKQHADWQTNAHAGQGAVREACELIMGAQDTLTQVQQPFLD